MRVLILAGGKGTRLFPLSRENFPKQFLKIWNNKSLLQLTVERALEFADESNIYIISGEEFKFIISEQLNEINADCNILVEPEGKNTFPAIVYGALEIEEGTMLVLPSDHYVEGDLYSYFRMAKNFAREYLITFGIKPNKPHTGYGYIKPGESIGDGIYKVERFIEKPDFEKAKEYVNSGYYWNSGMFMFDAELFLEEVERLYPGIVEAFKRSVKDGYEACENISVDYAVMEKTDKAAVVPVDIFWSDLGSYDSLYEVMKKDKDKNAILGEFIGIDSKRNLVISDRLVAGINLEDYLIIDTKDVLLVCKRGEAERVKKVVEILKERGDRRVKEHLTIAKPWGSVTALERSTFYKINKLVVKPGEKLSLHAHMHRSENWVIVSGIAKVTVEDKEFYLRRGESTFIPAGVKHRLENPGKIPLEVIEVSIGEYLEEDDIIRYEDEYGRS
ncbi:mannose-1-phosphate guanylyltransferase/mannose-6-phosphate isomerase [Ferroglobus placidus DSM 10642]|uniref:mannose-1-phosphate guanylyltransferase n=1 Tax=Ferroglobus placidus (strain DSM 10642 / AEDII12DO) TaxID=589924 RepID=D3S067_FERPA|nr:mannose-1-phosphate guanylyltransferase/mannose-6-phosphate isomerase [Ferroglobus placidus]ADC66130.1 mannose-1-phosphate guanylyltransferase/mannose-6-phosphate isomerase [Ferroglobus placidus DSM 10642]